VWENSISSQCEKEACYETKPPIKERILVVVTIEGIVALKDGDSPSGIGKSISFIMPLVPEDDINSIL
jgi:hypothetical protein